MTEKRYIIPNKNGEITDWTHEFKSWNKKLDSPVVMYEKSACLDVPYEMHSAHIFKQKNNRYLFVSECGCSCYEPDEAELFSDLSREEAENHIKKFTEEHGSMGDPISDIESFLKKISG